MERLDSDSKPEVCITVGKESCAYPCRVHAYPILPLTGGSNPNRISSAAAEEAGFTCTKQRIVF